MKSYKLIGYIVFSLIAIFLLVDISLNKVDAWCPSGGAGGGQIVPQRIPRPPSGTGLEPLVFNPPNPAPNLFFAWEIWWIRNRLNYLPFKEPIVWDTISDGEETVAVQTHRKLLEGIADALKNDSNPAARAMAALAFGKFKHKSGIRYLKAALADKSFDVKNVVRLSLGLFQDASFVENFKEILFSKKESDITKAYAALALGYIKDKSSVETLQEVFKEKKVPKDIACATLVSLGNIGDKSVIPFLDKILNKPKGDVQIRAYAALALGKIKDPEAVEILRKSLKEKNPDIRASIAIAFGMIKSPDTKDDLVALFKKDKNSRVRQFAAISLAQLGDKSVYATLYKTATSSRGSFDVKAFAILALGLLGEQKETNKFIKEIVIKKKPIIRPVAVLTLGLLKDKTAVPILLEILEKEQAIDPVSFLYAIQALGLIGDKEAIPALEKLYKKAQEDISMAAAVYNNLTVALTMLGKRKETLDILHKQLKEKKASEVILLRALHGTAYIGDKSSIDYLLDFYKDEKNLTLRMYAMFALGFVLDKDKINPLYKITADNNYYIWLNIMDHIYASKPD